MKKSYSIRMTEAQEQQIKELEERGFGNRTTIITMAVDRMYREEIQNYKFTFNWVNVLDRVPEFSGDYLVCSVYEDWGEYYMGDYRPGLYLADGEDIRPEDKNTTHWLDVVLPAMPEDWWEVFEKLNSLELPNS